MPEQRYRQAGFWRWRWGKCSRCGNTEKYPVRAKPGQRLREQKCRGCGALLGKNANSRAQPILRVGRDVERLARKMGVSKDRISP